MLSPKSFSLLLYVMFMSDEVQEHTIIAKIVPHLFKFVALSKDVFSTETEIVKLSVTIHSVSCGPSIYETGFG